MCLTVHTATAALITVGLWAWILLTLGTCKLGHRQPSAAGFGDTAALPAMGLTCSWSRVTPITRAVTGWVAKRSSVFKPDRSGAVNLSITGHLRIGSRSMAAIPTWVV